QAQGWTDSGTFPRFVIDMNGDGLADIIGFGSGNVKVALNTGTGFAAPQTWLSTEFTQAQGWTDFSTCPRFVIDMNGDGLPDIIGFAQGNVRVALNTGTGFAAPQTWLSTEFAQSQGWTDNSTYPRFVADVNGDGLPDIVGFAQ